MTKKVAIVGGGAAGLAAARVMSRAGLVPVVLEQDHALGGVWNYRLSKSKPMYRGLRTNLPKEIMAYREFPWPAQEASFLPHVQVLRYLHQYATKFELEKYLQLSSSVNKLALEFDAASAFSPTNETWPRIRVEWTHRPTGQVHSEDFDAVCVCNGHYSRSAIPSLPGLKEYHQGDTMHSIAYDSPEAFAGQTVLCIGGRASGADLAREMAAHAQHVYLSDSVAPPLDEDGKPTVSSYNVSWVPKTERVLPDGTIQFGKGCTVTPRVDVIIFCTGYDYDFPFLDDGIRQDLDFDSAPGSRRVLPLYEQLWHAKYPNVAFLGLPHSVVPFPLFELQAEACCRQWTACTLPRADERLDQARRDAASGGQGKENGRVPQDTHYLGNAQWEYCERMGAYGGVLNDDLRNYLQTNKAIYLDSNQNRKAGHPAGPDTYRSIRYVRDDTRRSFQSSKSEREATPI